MSRPVKKSSPARRAPRRPPRQHRPESAQEGTNPRPQVEVEVGPVAHGGHCVARHDGRVVFVRHALPGERVLAEITDGGEDARFWRADAVEVLEASPDRVPSAWPAAGPGGVGGGELAHVALPAQRRWKAAVLAEQLGRLAGPGLDLATRCDLQVEVEGAPGDDERGGLGYRTRIELVAGADGRAGMHRYRSHDVAPLDVAPFMPLATDEVLDLAAKERVFTRRWEPGARLELVAPAGGSPAMLLVDGVVWRSGHADTRPNARRSVTETVVAGGREHSYRVTADGFWQVHREAPALLAATVLDALGDVDGARVVDLYSGAGLFSLPIAHAVGGSGRVLAVEGDPRAVKDARRNAHGADGAGERVELLLGSVDTVLAAREHSLHDGADAVVLDPPRAGAGRGVVDEVAVLAPQRVVYVACDPAALARDVGYLRGHGYELTGLRAFDLFPHSHHVEAVAVLER